MRYGKGLQVNEDEIKVTASKPREWSALASTDKRERCATAPHLRALLKHGSTLRSGETHPPQWRSALIRDYDTGCMTGERTSWGDAAGTGATTMLLATVLPTVLPGPL